MITGVRGAPASHGLGADLCAQLFGRTLRKQLAGGVRGSEDAPFGRSFVQQRAAVLVSRPGSGAVHSIEVDDHAVLLRRPLPALNRLEGPLAWHDREGWQGRRLAVEERNGHNKGLVRESDAAGDAILHFEVTRESKAYTFMS